MDNYEARYRVLVVLIRLGPSTTLEIEKAVNESGEAGLDVLPVLELLNGECVEFEAATDTWQLSASTAQTYAFGRLIAESYRTQVDTDHALMSVMRQLTISLLKKGESADRIALGLELSYEFVLNAQNSE